MRAFPPRLSSQPFFYPVANFDYAAQIARDWNDQFGLKGKNAVQQFLALSTALTDYPMDFACELSANSKSIYLNFPFWTQFDFTSAGTHLDRRNTILNSIRKVWSNLIPLQPMSR